MLELRQLESVDAIRAFAAAWDDLWQRSATTIPTARAEVVALWHEHFAPCAVLRALVVEDAGRPVAAIPLVERRFCRILRCGSLTSNYWSPNGELLLDAQADAEPILEVLAGGMERLGWPLFWFDIVPSGEPHWQAMIRALRRRGLAVDVHPRWEVGQADWNGDVEGYLRSRPKSLRRNLARDARHLEETAPLEFTLEDRFTPESLDTSLREIFTLEDRGWKGEVGGSVLRHPSVFDFYRRQARQLAEWNSLRVARLVHAGKIIAFELGWLGRGIYHSYKVGYDPDHRRFGPGHLLRERLVRALADRGDAMAVDFQGPQNQALAAWSTGAYSIARLVIAQRRPTGRAAWAAYHVLAAAARLRRKVW